MKDLYGEVFLREVLYAVADYFMLELGYMRRSFMADFPSHNRVPKERRSSAVL